MSTERNPRPDAKLKRLPIEVMAELVRQLSTPGITQADAIAWLKSKHGVSTSASALSQQFTYLAARVRSHEREQKVQAWLECEKLEHPELSDEEIFRRGQRKFSLLSIAEEDPDAWTQVQRLGIQKDDLSLSKQKLELELKKYQDAMEKVKGELTKAKSKGGLTQETLKAIEEAAAIL